MLLRLPHLARIMRALLEPASPLERATTRLVFRSRATVLDPQIFNAALYQRVVLAKIMLELLVLAWLSKHALVKMVNQNLDIVRVPPTSNAARQRMLLLQPHPVRTMLVSLEPAFLPENAMTRVMFPSRATAPAQQISSVARYQRVVPAKIMLALLVLAWLSKHALVKMVNQNLDIVQAPPIFNAVPQRKPHLQRPPRNQPVPTMEHARIMQATLGSALALESATIRLGTRSPAIVLDRPTFSAVQYRRVALVKTMPEKRAPAWRSRRAPAREVNQSLVTALGQQIFNVVHSQGVQRSSGIDLEICLHTHVFYINLILLNYQVRNK
jgi:hypothetical protein